MDRPGTHLPAAVLTITSDAGMPRVYRTLGQLDRELVTLGRRNAGITIIPLWSNVNRVTNRRHPSGSGPTVELTYHSVAHKMTADRGPA